MDDDPNGGLSLGPSEKGDPAMTIGYLLKMIRTDNGMHVDILATASAMLLGFLALLGSQRRRCRNKAFLFVLGVAYDVSYIIVSYTIGIISPNSAGSQLLWAVVLLLLLGSADTISAFSRHDVEQSKGMQTKHVFQTLLVLWLLLSPRSLAGGGWIVTPFLLLCWVYSIFKMFQRATALRMACMAEYGLVRGAKVVADYMVSTVATENATIAAAAADDTGYDPKNMTGYKYLVLGEEEHATPPSKPPYLTMVPVGGGDGKIVTIDMIWSTWKHDGDNQALKDTCLSFALFKLLKRRFCGLQIAEAGQAKTRDLVLHGLLGLNDVNKNNYQHRREVAERAFHVVEVELSFLYDLFYTKYPALFPTKRVIGVVRFFFLLIFFVVLLYFSIDAVWAARHPQDPAPYYAFTIFNDFALVAMIFAIDILQQLVTRYSNWAVVHFVCNYVRAMNEKKQPSTRCRCRCWGWIRQQLIKFVASRRHRKTTYWDHMLGQYSLLESMEYNSRFTNTISLLTFGLMDRKRIGRKPEPHVRLPAEVVVAVAAALRRCLERVGHGCCSLTNGMNSIKDGEEEAGGLIWACRLTTTTHTVLVWHIATTLCDVQDNKAFIAKDDDGARALAIEKLRRDHDVATCLSRYCAYLLAFVPEMLPDQSYTATQILDAVVEEARQALVDDTAEGKSKAKQILDAIVGKRKAREYLGNTEAFSNMILDKMKKLGATADEGNNNDEETPILNLGARLHSRLVKVAMSRRWELLAEFWAELVLFLAPSDNTDIHAEHLAKGGEFMTHIWVLLNHAGILKRPDYFTQPAVSV